MYFWHPPTSGWRLYDLMRISSRKLAELSAWRPVYRPRVLLRSAQRPVSSARVRLHVMGRSWWTPVAFWQLCCSSPRCSLNTSWTCAASIRAFSEASLGCVIWAKKTFCEGVSRWWRLSEHVATCYNRWMAVRCLKGLIVFLALTEEERFLRCKCKRSSVWRITWHCWWVHRWQLSAGLWTVVLRTKKEMRRRTSDRKPKFFSIASGSSTPHSWAGNLSSTSMRFYLSLTPVAAIGL